MRQVRDRHQQRAALLLDLIELDFELPDLLRARLVGRKHVARRPAPAAWRAATSSPAAFCSRFRPSTSGISRRRRASSVGDLLELRVRIEATVAQAGSDVLHVIAHERGIEHRVQSYTGRSPLIACVTGYRLRSDPQLWRSVVTQPIRKAVFPAAGLGTRFLPATKAQPKEMLPLVDKPIIQYGVEEAVASGVDNIILVTGRGKNAIEDHFDVSVELETFLEARGKNELLAEIRKISNLINFAYVRQGEPLGLGHAVLVTRDAGRRRAVRGHPRRRRDRCEAAGAAADD